METKNLWQRMAEAMSHVDYVQKEKKSGMNYSIVSHDAVTAKVRPALLSAGVHYYPIALSHSQDGNRTQVALTVRFTNIDNPSEFIDVPSLGYGIDSQDKGPGKAISYAVKYALLKALGLETGDDPDFEQDVKHSPAIGLLPSAHNNTKNNTREAMQQLCREIDSITRVIDLEAWANRKAGEIGALNDDLKETVRNSYSDKLKELKEGLAA